MEAAYRRAVTGKRKAQRTEAMHRGEKRRLIQLLVSLCLFLIVFLGRGAFPVQAESWNGILTRDTDFAAFFAGLVGDTAEGGTLRSALGRLADSFLGTENREPAETTPVQPTIPEEQVLLLSETSRRGLQYVRENSFLRELQFDFPEIQVPDSGKAPAEPAETEPEVVTAVAQAYSPDGEALPKKVSFQFYELGLEKTVVPVMGTVTSEFGYRIGPISGKREFHLAIDIAAAKGTEILAFADGIVRYIGESDSFGLYLMIDHDNGVSTFYAHCSKLLVRKGDKITCGQTVALVGDTGNATGPHLHFTLSKDDIRLDPTYYVAPEETGRG